MPKFLVYMKVNGTASVEVEAVNAEEAREKVDNDYVDSPISICHQCSDRVSDPSYGEIVEVLEQP